MCVCVCVCMCVTVSGCVSDVRLLLLSLLPQLLLLLLFGCCCCCCFIVVTQLLQSAVDKACVLQCCVREFVWGDVCSALSTHTVVQTLSRAPQPSHPRVAVRPITLSMLALMRGCSGGSFQALQALNFCTGEPCIVCPLRDARPATNGRGSTLFDRSVPRTNAARWSPQTCHAHATLCAARDGHVGGAVWQLRLWSPRHAGSANILRLFFRALADSAQT